MGAQRTPPLTEAKPPRPFSQAQPRPAAHSAHIPPASGRAAPSPFSLLLPTAGIGS